LSAHYYHVHATDTGRAGIGSWLTAGNAARKKHARAESVVRELSDNREARDADGRAGFAGAS